MGIYMRNVYEDEGFGSTGWRDNIYVLIENEPIANGVVVRKLEGFYRVPDRTTFSYTWLHLVANSDGSEQDLDFTAPFTEPERDVSRVIGAWGTDGGNAGDTTFLMRQTQLDREVQFIADWDFYPDLASGPLSDGNFGFEGSGQFIRREHPSHYMHGPPGLTYALLFRGESWRRSDGDSNNLGIAQVNIWSAKGVSSGETPASNGGDEMLFRQQVKGLSRVGQKEVYMDRMVVPVDNFDAPAFVAQCAVTMGGHVMASGYILR